MGLFSHQRKPKRAKLKPPPSYLPHDCVTINVDTAENSGWAITVRGRLVRYGEVDMLRAHRSTDSMGEAGWTASRVCEQAFTYAKLATLTGPRPAGIDTPPKPLPVVLVYELPYGGQHQGQWTGVWKGAFVAHGGTKSRMRGVQASSWRARVTGLGRAGRETARRGDMARAQREVASMWGDGGVSGEWSKIKLGGDEAAAICIGCWSAHAGEVGALLPKPRVAKPKAPRPARLSAPKPRKPRQAPAEAPA